MYRPNPSEAHLQVCRVRSWKRLLLNGEFLKYWTGSGDNKHKNRIRQNLYW